jgi:hypothetical protein
MLEISPLSQGVCSSHAGIGVLVEAGLAKTGFSSFV